MSRGSAKHRYSTTAVPFAREPVPLEAIHLLSRRDIHEIEHEQFGFGEGVGVLAEHSFHLPSRPEQLAPETFTVCAEISAEVGVHHLSVPNGLDRLEGTVAAVAERLSAAQSFR